MRPVLALTVGAAVMLGSSSSIAVASPRTDSERARASKGAVITVSPVSRLSASGATVRVRGRGFDPRVGIYVALCVTPKPDVMPSPCGGGVNMDAADPSSIWISSNPPPYGRDLAIPYAKRGKFSVRLRISPMIGDVDCREVSCSIVTRADHTRLGDRGFDAAVPVSFG